MNAQRNPLRTFLFALIAAAAVSINLTSCSSGTEDGDTNVERGYTKSKNPEKRNPNPSGSSDRGSTYEEERDERTNTGKQKDYYEDAEDRDKRDAGR